MRWLQWSTSDLKNGLGGVETYARSLDRELRALGIESALSSSVDDLHSEKWDVIQTHGSAWRPTRSRTATRVQTLHGTTLGRMLACGPWAWPGGYLAESRELRGALASDLVLSVRPNSIHRLAERLGRRCRVTWNGWDAAALPEPLSPELQTRIDAIGRFWLFLGRGEDRMKGADRIQAAIARLPDVRFVAAPGGGFESMPGVVRTGLLGSGQVAALLERASGLLVPSRYEGNALVVLEGLAYGAPVVATPVGAVPDLPPGLEGLEIIPNGRPSEIIEAIRRAMDRAETPEGRARRRDTNRKLLPKWSDVARIALDAVLEIRKGI